MIRKGALTLVRQLIRSGVVFHVVNEKKEVCIGEHTSLLIDGKMHKPDAEGKFMIPYGDSDQNHNAIVIYKDFAELLKVNVPREEIRFDATLLFNEESLFTGCTTEFLLQPKVFVCGKLVPLSVVSEPSVEVKVTNDKGVNNSRTYDNLKLSYEEDLSIKYLVPPKTKTITVLLKAKVKNLS